MCLNEEKKCLGGKYIVICTAVLLQEWVIALIPISYILESKSLARFAFL